ncbi:MAG TPA: protein kinase [Myxococcales bacterium]|jgi:tRNA A-37 threonylcarbamoyl transferase component Bud32
MPPSPAEFLSRLPGFAVVDPEQLAALEASVQLRKFAAGDCLMRRGDPGDHMQVLMDGRVCIRRLDAQGNPRQVFHLGVGDMVGEMALLTGEPRNADVVAETDTVSIVLTRDALEPLLDEHPQLAAFMTEVLGRRLEEGGGLEKVGKYRLLRKIGEGTTGRVYEALHPGLDRLVAVKMLSHALVYHRTFRDRFLEEARTVARFSHPNIVSVYDTEEAYATFFIVMERLKGTDLAAVLETRRVLPADEAVAILRQLAAALEAAHKHGFAHRDVKPANVAMDDSGLVKLMDFGLASPILKDADGKRSKTVEGTPQYLAPEAAIGQIPDGRADVYALGIMAFEMVTGTLPFTADKVVDMLKAHVRQPAPDVLTRKSDVPAPLVEFIRGALIKKPSERLTDWARIRTLLEPANARPTELWSDPQAHEAVVRVRFAPGAAQKVEAALANLATDLQAVPGVQLSRGDLQPVQPAGKPRA